MSIDCEYKDLIPICVITANEFLDDNIPYVENANIDDILKNPNDFAEEKLMNKFSDNFNYTETIKQYFRYPKENRPKENLEIDEKLK